ncbi:MAG: hypothetical protein PVI97_16330 [Candidatus Thiodiazotropha sp.]|jgi:hypothetical protein
MKKTWIISLPLQAVVGLTLYACNSGGGSGDSDDPQTSASTSGMDMDLTSKLLVNEAAYIPSQCYTKTIDSQEQVHNPCYSCHIPTEEPNYLNDSDLQISYSFADYANTNQWINLFTDRSQAVAAISDQEILDYVRGDNYLDAQGRIILAQTLETLPTGWDYDEDGDWDGYTPDCYLNFNDEGFDVDPQGNLTGWRAFGYAPFLGTFWPTNGSTDDVFIRLPTVLRNDIDGNFDLQTYKVNLAIVEAIIKRQDVELEESYTENGVDLDKDGNLYGTATQVVYDWAPLEGRYMYFVGQGKVAQDAGEIHLAGSLYPEGTEFLHSVRYIDLDNDDEIKLAARMKELRYAKKQSWLTYSDLQDITAAELKEKHDFPDRLKQVIGNVEQGVTTGKGWVYQGFIEDADGALRPQTYEENVFCVGCHGGIGGTTDTIFSFSRKFTDSAFRHGWYHWSQKGLRNQPESIRHDGNYEYSYYLQQNGAGDEFRANQEVMDKFFDEEGQIKTEELEILHDDMAHLLFPSRERALLLNKAYKVIVEEQGFVFGRDATVTPPENVHESVTPDQATGVTLILTGPESDS